MNKNDVLTGNYEKMTEDGVVREFYYLNGNVIVVRENGGVFTPYLAFKDNLGSFLSIYDRNGDPVFEADYDAWGQQTVRLNEIGFQRGYTGHEMLNEFGLINMNGRIYDPFIARFLSPDNYVQAPLNSQSFNRYSYCLNNPLKYTDPSGESWVEYEDIVPDTDNLHDIHKDCNKTKDSDQDGGGGGGITEAAINLSEVVCDGTDGRVSFNSSAYFYWLFISQNAANWNSQYGEYDPYVSYVSTGAAFGAAAGGLADKSWRGRNGKWYNKSLLNARPNGKFVKGITGYRNSFAKVPWYSKGLMNISQALGYISLLHNVGSLVFDPSGENLLHAATAGISVFGGPLGVCIGVVIEGNYFTCQRVQNGTATNWDWWYLTHEGCPTAPYFYNNAVFPK